MKGWELTFTKTQHAAMKRVNSTTTDTSNKWGVAGAVVFGMIYVTGL